MTNPDRCREEFEKLIVSVPFEQCISRFPNDAEKNALPSVSGRYQSITTEIAWNISKATTQATARRCVELCHYVYEHSPDDRKPAVMECLVTITTEFGLQGE